MVGDYPPDPGNVDLHTFHSLEARWVRACITLTESRRSCSRAFPARAGPLFIMETGYREWQGISPFTGNLMRFEPRPSYFQADPGINITHSPAMSDKPETWPAVWPDKLGDPIDPGWPGHWNGFLRQGPWGRPGELHGARRPTTMT